MIVCREAELDDWSDLLRLLDGVGLYKDRLQINKESMERALINSRNPMLPYRLQVVSREGILRGFAVLVTHPSPDLYSTGMGQGALHCLLHCVYVDPHEPLITGEEFFKSFEEWALSRGATHMYANIRLSGKFGALCKRYGLVPQQQVVGKELR